MSKFPAHHILFALNSVSTIAIKAVYCARTTLLMVLFLFLFLFLNPSSASATTRLSVTNQCNFPVWMVTIPNANIPPLSDSTAKENQDLGVVKALRKPVPKLDLSHASSTPLDKGCSFLNLSQIASA